MMRMRQVYGIIRKRERGYKRQIKTLEFENLCLDFNKDLDSRWRIMINEDLIRMKQKSG